MGCFDWLFRRNRRQAAAPMAIGGPVAVVRTFRYWNTPAQPDQPAGPGIRVEVPPHSRFHDLTLEALDAVYSCPVGKDVLDHLIQSRHEITISKASMGNACGTGGCQDGMNLVARNLVGQATAIKTNTKSALEVAESRVRSGDRFTWLANQINATPHYKLRGVPPVAGHNVGVTAVHVRDWFQNDVNLDAPAHGFTGEQVNHIRNAIILALYPYTPKGRGCGSGVMFNPEPGFILNQERPAGLGLAHELVHAYFNSRGMQPGYEVDDPTTVLFEHLCVGLGHWDYANDGVQICENRVREEWFANTAALFAVTDHINRRDPGRRDFYSAAA